MNQPKWNRHPWYSLGLALILCVAALVTATGPVLARYQATRNQFVSFEVRPPAQISMGVVETVEKEDGTTANVFKPTNDLELKEETKDELYLLDVAIANGSSEESFSEKAQTVSFRLLCSLGITDGTRIFLRIPQEEGYREVPGVIQEIAEGSSLYVTNGPGYIYTFCEQEDGTEEPGKELSWLLPGGKLEYIELTVAMKGKLPDHEVLIQPQVVADLTK